MLGSVFHRVTVAALAAVVGVALVGGAALAWSGHIGGKPASFGPGSTDGYYIWNDEDGLHLRTTDSAGIFEYSGVLRTNGRFEDVALVQPESPDQVEILDGGKEIRFHFRTAQGIDGFNFRVAGGMVVHFDLKRNGQTVDPANIFLGEDGVHPPSNPFTIHRNHLHDAELTATTTTTS